MHTYKHVLRSVPYFRGLAAPLNLDNGSGLQRLWGSVAHHPHADPTADAEEKFDDMAYLVVDLAVVWLQKHCHHSWKRGLEIKWSDQYVNLRGASRHPRLAGVISRETSIPAHPELRRLITVPLLDTRGPAAQRSYGLEREKTGPARVPLDTDVTQQSGSGSGQSLGTYRFRKAAEQEVYQLADKCGPQDQETPAEKFLYGT